MDEKYFKYGKKETDYLKSKDPILGSWIEERGHIKREVIPDLYMALLNSITGQQISTKAHTTIWNRMKERFYLSPESLGKVSVEELQACGMTMRKANYIEDLTDEILEKRLYLDSLHKLTDQEIQERLVKLKGVGLWTAEMVMIFSMERPDILSYDDLAIRRGLIKLYGLPGLTTLNKENFNEYKERYSPYGSVASLYIWEKSRV